MRIRKKNGTLAGWLAAAILTLGAAPAPVAAAEDIARPSNPGPPGDAATLSGHAKAGAKLFVVNCQPCHGAKGKGGIPNPGSADGSVPPLNPIDPTLLSKDPKLFAVNVDLFIEHGSTPEGPKPAITMPAWGADKRLTQQQIADLIAYLRSLNPGKKP